MSAVILIDYASRHLISEFDIVAFSQVEFSIPETKICSIYVVCADEIEYDRAKRNSGPHGAVIVSNVRRLIRRKRPSVVINLLGVEAGTRADFEEIKRTALESDSQYFGPNLQGPTTEQELICFDSPVISIAAGSKHSGKTLLASAISREMMRRGWNVTIISVERSPKTIGLLHNAKSDTIRLDRLGHHAKHWLRIGDRYRGVARIVQAETLPKADLKNIILVDNSGASVAPVKADIGIMVGKTMGETSNILQLFSNRKVLIGGKAKVDGFDLGYASVGYRVTFSRLPSIEPSTRYFVYLLYNGDGAFDAIRELVVVDIIKYVTSESELSKMRIRPSDVLITDDYDWQRLSTYTDNIIQIAVTMDNIDIPALDDL
jgi:hypothetical protein